MSLSVQRTFRASAFALVASVVASTAAQAQVGGIDEAALRGPWTQQLAVLQSLSETIAGEGSAVGDDLAMLEVALGEFETQVDEVIDRLIGDMQFAFVAAETSQALAAKVGEVHRSLSALYARLAVLQRADVEAAQAAVDELRKTLAAKTPFERDVMVASAPATRQPRVDLATRWWNGEEQAIAVKKLVGALRQRVEGIAPPGERH
jgi:hypothetical protein